MKGENVAKLAGGAGKTNTKNPIRPNISKALEIALCTQANQVCPDCGDPLFKKRGKSQYKNYEIAHIYPLHPLPEEVELLKDLERLSVDPNHDHNLIPLCYSCHNIFDNPKTVEGYLALVENKKNLVKRSDQLGIFQQYQLEKEIVQIINSLLDDRAEFGEPFSLEVKTVDSKLGGNVKPITKINIKNYVSSFYLFVRDRFAEMERNTPGKAVLIAQQVKTFYLKQKSLSLSHQEILENTIDWINSKFKHSSREAAEVIAAFYIQNCELFE
jgi:hypothetical protein